MDNFTLHISLQEVVLRITMAIIIGGAIGYERAQNNRPAGFRTHILVCLGAAIVSLVQDNLRISVLTYALANPIMAKAVKTDLGRIGAKVVSGIGFLGAGTIMRGKGVIEGLTTAASIWVTGCIGLGIGWGFYYLSVMGGLAALITLGTFKIVERSLIDNRMISKVSIEFNPEKTYEENIYETYKILKDMKIKVKTMKKKEEEKSVLYTLNIPKELQTFDLISSISSYDHVKKVQIY